MLNNKYDNVELYQCFNKNDISVTMFSTLRVTIDNVIGVMVPDDMVRFK